LYRGDGDDGQIDGAGNVADGFEDLAAGDRVRLGIDQVDVSFVPAGQHVGKQHVAPFSQLGGRADKGHRLGVKHLSDFPGIDGRPRGDLQRPFSENDQGVNGDHMAVRFDQERIDVHFRDGVPVERQAREGDQRFNDFLAADGRFAPEGAEQLCGADFIEHRFRLAFIHGRHAENDVADGFRKNAAQTEHDNRAELRIAKQAGDKLAFSLNHGGDEIPFQVVSRRRGDSAGRLAHGLGGFEVEVDEPPFRFVR